MRELRVEDALMYLDQVKMEFGDRPHIYNEFLDIMKTFKSQQIDTPGVIQRVSSLFHGNKKLVLGFNTFLPEGYKIELPIDGTGPAVYRAPGQAGVTQIFVPGQQPQGPGPASAAGSAASMSQQQGGLAQSQQGEAPPAPGPPRAGPGMPPHQQQSHGPRGPHPHQQHGPPSHAPLQRGQQQGQQFGSGSMVVDQSPAGSASGSGPPFQQQHLPHQQAQQQKLQMQQIAHQQQQQQQGQQMMPPNEAASRVQQSRVAGRVDQSQDQAVQPPGHPGGAAQHHHQQQQTGPSGVPGGLVSGQQQPPSAIGPDGHVAPRIGGPPQGGAVPAGMPVGPPHGHSHQQPPPPQQPVEFDHAINYVTTIKKRFAAEPETYKKFLEILHTYQKEQRGIKEVLDEVSLLFADHPDLLKEFTYFLPDAVQAQAKMQLDEVAKIAEARKRAQSAKQPILPAARQRPIPQQGQMGPGIGRGPPPVGGPPGPPVRTGPAVFAPAPAPVPFGATQGRTEEREREICRSAMYGVVSFAPARPPRRNELTPAQAALKYGRPTMIPEQPTQPTCAEAAFFDRARLHLNRKELMPDKPPGSRRHTPHAEFLKCLHLFGAGILNKEELVLLLRGLFMQGHAPKSGVNAGGGASNPVVAQAATELLREFEEILVGRGPYAEQEQIAKDKSKYGSISTRDYNYSRSERPTPSYRTYPPDFLYEQFFTHSGQSEEDAAVLNNTLICHGPDRSGGSKQKLIASPEDYDGAKARRNMYEEALHRLEDEMYEVDMAIDRNASAMRQVNALDEETTKLRENEEKDGQPIGRMQYKLRSRTLSSVHIGAIARLYGESGDEVIQHLMRYPISVIPIVFCRLREKDQEWRKVKADLATPWKAVAKANQAGSFDIKCYFYRREIERSVSTDQMLEECKRARYYFKHPRKQHHHEATAFLEPEFRSFDPDEKKLLFQSHLKFNISNDMPHKDAFDCLSAQIMNGIAKTSADRERVSRIWAEFVAPMFNLPAHWFLKELREKIRPDKSSCVVKYAPGQNVRTAFGKGHILSMIEGNPSTSLRYKIKFPFGIGFVRPSAIIHVLPSTSKAQFARTGGFMEFVERPEELGDEIKAKALAKSCHILFGTEKIYIFLRLYVLVVALLSQARDLLEDQVGGGDTRKKESGSRLASRGKPTGNGSTATSVRDVGKQSEYHGFYGLVMALKEYIGGKIDYKTFETSCRSLTKEKVYSLAALPRLIEKCSESLVKVAKEDVLLNIFDYSQLKHMDPVLLRSQSLSITSDANYRIQYQPAEGYMCVSYIAKDAELLMSPKVGSAGGSGNAGGPTNGDEEDEQAMEVEAEEDIKEKGREHQAKRPKLK